MARLLLTGSAGLIGRALSATLSRQGHEVQGYDIRHPPGHPEHGDVRQKSALRARARGCDGIIHLAAIARVGAGEADPELCHAVNVEGVGNLLAVAARLPGRPFVLLASSREVYGEPAVLPVAETAPLLPINVYGRSKAAAEGLVETARAAGLRTQIVRYANVYGCIHDHPDRVVPAFACAAASGGEMRVRGAGNSYDFTHVDDVARGTAQLVAALLDGERALPPLQLVSGAPTRLDQLARLARRLGGDRARYVEEPSVDRTVSRFWGDPSRARALLGWQAEIDLPGGLAGMVDAFSAMARTAPAQNTPVQITPARAALVG